MGSLLLKGNFPQGLMNGLRQDIQRCYHLALIMLNVFGAQAVGRCKPFRIWLLNASNWVESRNRWPLLNVTKHKINTGKCIYPLSKFWLFPFDQWTVCGFYQSTGISSRFLKNGVKLTSIIQSHTFFSHCTWFLFSFAKWNFMNLKFFLLLINWLLVSPRWEFRIIPCNRDTTCNKTWQKFSPRGLQTMTL